tara:strand:- start:43 stop:483 length:441 start_codon:yes stop_codon:yes gene_type:complete
MCNVARIKTPIIMYILDEVSSKTKKEFYSLIIDAINDGRLIDKPMCEIHHEVFNTDYFIIGYYQAEEWLKENIGIFNAIGIIKEYENDQFGELTTDISSSESVVNMTAYLLGDEIINSLDVISDNYDKIATDELLKELQEELEEMM